MGDGLGRLIPMTSKEPWYAVRCVFAFEGGESTTYEERVTLWRASSFEDAVEDAEREAAEYAGALDAQYLGLAQAYHVAVEDRPLESGDEVFSLMRRSDLSPDEYLRSFFSTGTEHEGPASDPPL
jgi:hypothetical protein